MPCVFAPYAGADINKVYAEGSDLGDVWRAPFFEGIRAWQRDHDPRRATSPAAGNWLASCPVRDHYPDFRECVDRCRPEPEDDAALALLTDDKYLAGMAAYGDDLALAAIGLCEHVYVR
jgi:hypothetical protein